MLAEKDLSLELPTAWTDQMPDLEQRIASKLPAWRERVRKLIQEHGDDIISQVTVSQAYGGTRGVNTMISEISHIDPEKGIRLRGYTIPEVLENLPREKGHAYPLVGGLYFLLLVGEMPTLTEALMVEEEWKKRSVVPEYVFQILRALPKDTHPMTMFSQAILAMQHESHFAHKYQDGTIQKADYWRATLEDSLDLTAKLPTIAAFIYNLRYMDGNFIEPDPSLDWSGNFAHMIGKSEYSDYVELCRLFFILHSDHEGANASAHASHLVNSTLADVYYSCSAAMSALSGPLHGLANQECLKWLLSVRESFDEFPTAAQLEAYAWETLNSGKVIPGYGHAVLRTTDPRFTAQLEFGETYCPNDEIYRLVKLVYQVVPDVLSKLGKVKNPWPNVDAINGTLQYHYGVREFNFYTVLFGVSRILGITADAVWSRALGFPIERPQSLTTEMVEKLVQHT